MEELNNCFSALALNLDDTHFRYAIIIQKNVRKFLQKRRILIPSNQFQTKKWRIRQKWYNTGKQNECEKYQLELLNRITNCTLNTTKHIRINVETNCLENNRNPMTIANGFEWTEDFDVVLQRLSLTLYINLKFVCDAGGAQTRSLREVYHFIKAQIAYLKTSNVENIFFVNILDGDTSFKHTDKFLYLHHNPLYKNYSNKIFIGDMQQFQELWLTKFA